MVRPCDNCGGSGGDESTYKWQPTHMGPSEIEPCPTCVDMPWLPARKGGKWVTQQSLAGGINYQSPSWYQDGGKFKPDRSTVLRWCRIHESVVDGHNTCCKAVTLTFLNGDAPWREVVGD